MEADVAIQVAQHGAEDAATRLGAAVAVTFPQKSGHRVMLFSGLPALG
jgi:hypothetical protein